METPEIVSVISDWFLENTASIVTAFIVLFIGWHLSSLASRAIAKLLPKARHIDQDITPLLTQLVRYAIFLVALVIALNEFGVQTTSILAIMGAAGLAIALALQGTLSNVAAGVMLLWLRPMSIGDYIDGNGISGTITSVGLFGTRLRSVDGLYVFAPNSQLWDSAITNYSREPRRRLNIRVGIGYSSSILDARNVLMTIASADMRVLSEPAPVVHVEELGDSAVTMLLRCWVSTPDYWSTRFDFTEQAKLEFDKAGIEIPYNKLDVTIIGGGASADGSSNKS